MGQGSSSLSRANRNRVADLSEEEFRQNPAGGSAPANLRDLRGAQFVSASAAAAVPTAEERRLGEEQVLADLVYQGLSKQTAQLVAEVISRDPQLSSVALAVIFKKTIEDNPNLPHNITNPYGAPSLILSLLQQNQCSEHINRQIITRLYETAKSDNPCAGDCFDVLRLLSDFETQPLCTVALGDLAKEGYVYQVGLRESKVVRQEPSYVNAAVHYREAAQAGNLEGIEKFCSLLMQGPLHQVRHFFIQFHTCKFERFFESIANGKYQGDLRAQRIQRQLIELGLPRTPELTCLMKSDISHAFKPGDKVAYNDFLQCYHGDKKAFDRLYLQARNGNDSALSFLRRLVAHPPELRSMEFRAIALQYLTDRVLTQNDEESYHHFRLLTRLRVTGVKEALRKIERVKHLSPHYTKLEQIAAESALPESVLVAVGGCLALKPLLMNQHASEVVGSPRALPAMDSQTATAMRESMIAIYQEGLKESAEEEMLEIIHEGILTLVGENPINDVDPTTQDEIAAEDRVVTSSGHQFDLPALVAYHHGREYKGLEFKEGPNSKWLLNPITREPFEKRDVAHILAEAAKRVPPLEVRNLKLR